MPRGPILVQADAGRLQQVFVNVLSNAVEHAAMSPTIDVTVRRSGSVAMVEVRDYGPGIASHVMPQLFQPYTRLGSKPSTGLGLGLYLAREIVAAHGGTIEAESILARVRSSSFGCRSARGELGAMRCRPRRQERDPAGDHRGSSRHRRGAHGAPGGEPDVTVVGTARTGDAADRLIEAQSPTSSCATSVWPGRWTAWRSSPATCRARHSSC